MEKPPLILFLSVVFTVESVQLHAWKTIQILPPFKKCFTDKLNVYQFAYFSVKLFFGLQNISQGSFSSTVWSSEGVFFGGGSG